MGKSGQKSIHSTKDGGQSLSRMVPSNSGLSWTKDGEGTRWWITMFLAHSCIGGAAENFGTARAWSKPCKKTGHCRSNRRESMHSSDVGDRFPRLKRKKPTTIDDRLALFRRGAAAENFGTARARSNPPPCNKTGCRRSNRRERMHSSDVGDGFPCLKCKNPPTIDDRIALFRWGAKAENFGTARARSNLPPYNKTGCRRSNCHERMHLSDVGDRFFCLKRKI